MGNTSISRQRVVAKLKEYFIHEFVENFPDGSAFDCDVLDTLNKLEERWGGLSDDENET